MSPVSRAIRCAVLAALAAPATAGCGSKECTVDRPSPLPTTIFDGGCTKGTSYDVTVSDVGACGGADAASCDTICGQPVASCTYGAQNVVTCTTMTLCGKARTSLRWRRKKLASPLAEHIAASVWLEAASIDAFYMLRRELAAHGAPEGLRRAAGAAARDERRHTRAMLELAKRHRVAAPLPRRRRARAIRTLRAIAIENVIEGCVHETFGAALARFQATRARDPRVRAAMRQVARDEARHAALAVAVARWAASRLTPEQRDVVRAARDRAVRELRASLAQPTASELVETLGMPTPAEAITLARELEARLWT